MNKTHKSNDTSSNVDAILPESMFASWMCLICKIRAHHYVKREISAGKMCFAVSVLGGELAEAVSSLCDFEKFCETSSGHAQD